MIGAYGNHCGGDGVTALRGGAERVGVRGTDGRTFLTQGLASFDHVDEVMMRFAAREKMRDQSSLEVKPAVVVTPYSPEVVKEVGVAELFPEYQPISVGEFGVRGSGWNALRFMMTKRAMDASFAEVGSVGVIGDGLYQSVSQGLKRVHLQTEPGNLPATEAYHESVKAVSGTMMRASAVEREHGPVLSAMGRDEFVLGDSYDVCDASAGCNRAVGALVVDLSLHALTIPQVCAAVLRAGARFAEVFFPHSSGLLNAENGEFGATGVRHALLGDVLSFDYPEGAFGIPYTSFAAYKEWFDVASVTVGYDRQLFKFKVETLESRGPFMRCRLVCATDAVVVNTSTTYLRGLCDRADRECELISRPVHNLDVAYVTVASGTGDTRVAIPKGLFGAFQMSQEPSQVLALPRQRVASRPSDADVRLQVADMVRRIFYKVDGARTVTDVQEMWDGLLDALGVSGDVPVGQVDERLVEWGLALGSEVMKRELRSVMGDSKFDASWRQDLDFTGRQHVVYNPSDYIDVSMAAELSDQCVDVDFSAKLCTGQLVALNAVGETFRGATVSGAVLRASETG